MKHVEYMNTHKTLITFQTKGIMIFTKGIMMLTLNFVEVDSILFI